MSSWLAFFAPAGTPAPVIMRLHDEIVRILNTEAVKDKLASLGFAVAPSAPNELADAVKTGLEVRGRLMKSAGVQPE
jgi:tripartite-type tricarboxylate transporter receptor subunit TctC